MNWLWPHVINPSQGFFGRLGRLAHWAGILLAVGCALVPFFTYGGPDLQTFAAAFGFGAFFYMAGRGVRYLFAGE